MALRLAYGQSGYDLWAETHIDDRARDDAPAQWASFAVELQPGYVTLATILRAARGANFRLFEPNEPTVSADPILNATCETAFTRLAALSRIDYDRVRKSEAENLGVRVTTLDEEVDKRRPTQDDVQESEGQGQRIRFRDIEPWSSPVSGVEILDEIEAAYKRYVVMPDDAASALALWVIFTHCYEEFEHSPRIALQSPEPRCGKTSVLKVTERLVPRAQRADNVTPAVLFRMIEAYSPTFLVDEADAFAREHDELRGIINFGHEKGGSVPRTVGDDHEPRAFKTWGPMMIAGIGGLAGTIEDRSIIVRLKRKRRDEKVERFRSTHCEHLHDLARKVVRWVQDHRMAVRDADPAIPDELGDRAADNWRPLLAIADETGGQLARPRQKCGGEPIRRVRR